MRAAKTVTRSGHTPTSVAPPAAADAPATGRSQAAPSARPRRSSCMTAPLDALTDHLAEVQGRCATAYSALRDGCIQSTQSVAGAAGPVTKTGPDPVDCPYTFVVPDYTSATYNASYYAVSQPPFRRTRAASSAPVAPPRADVAARQHPEVHDQQRRRDDDGCAFR
jgi:hypothetical protein